MAQTPAIAALEKQGIAYRILSFSAQDHAGNYGRNAAAELNQSESQVFKTLMVELDSKRLVVGMVPVAKHLDLRAVARLFSARKAKLAEPQLAQRATGYVLGGISPLGQKRRSPTVIDQSALGFAEIFISAGKRGLELAIAPQALRKALDAQIAAIATA